MRRIDIMPSDLVDAGTHTYTRVAGSYLYVKGSATNTRMWLGEADRDMVAELVGEEGIAFCMLENHRAAVIKSGGKRRISRANNGKAFISVGDKGTKAIADRMLPDGGSFGAALEPVRLGDGTLAVYVEFGGAE